MQEKFKQGKREDRHILAIAEAMAEYLIEPVEEPLWDSVTLTRTTTPGTDADDTGKEIIKIVEIFWTCSA